MFFQYKLFFVSREKPTGERILLLLNSFNILILEVYQKFDKNRTNQVVENRTRLNLSTFSVSIRVVFHIKNCIYLFVKVYWTTNFSLKNVFDNLLHEIYRKFDKKLHKKVGKFRNVCYFWGHFGDILVILEKVQKSLQMHIAQR